MPYTETIEYETDNNIYEITAEYKVVIDNNDGADADGNRGREVTYIEDVTILSIVKQGTENNLVDLIPESIMRKLEEWFSDRCDPAKEQEAEMYHQADMKYDSNKEE